MSLSSSYIMVDHQTQTYTLSAKKRTQLITYAFKISASCRRVFEVFTFLGCYAMLAVRRIRIMIGFEPFRAWCTSALKQALCAPYSMLSYRNPVPLVKFQMAPLPNFIITSESRKKEPRYKCRKDAFYRSSLWVEPSVESLLESLIAKHSIFCFKV